MSLYTHSSRHFLNDKSKKAETDLHLQTQEPKIHQRTKAKVWFFKLFSIIILKYFSLPLFFNSYYLFSHYCDFPPDKSYTRWPKLHYVLCTFGSGAVFHGLGWTSLVPVRGNLNATAYNHILYINGVGSFFYFNISKHAQRQIHRKNVLVLTSTPSNTFQIKWNTDTLWDRPPQPS